MSGTLAAPNQPNPQAVGGQSAPRRSDPAGARTPTVGDVYGLLEHVAAVQRQHTAQIEDVLLDQAHGTDRILASMTSSGLAMMQSAQPFSVFPYTYAWPPGDAEASVADTPSPTETDRPMNESDRITRLETHFEYVRRDLDDLKAGQANITQQLATLINSQKDLPTKGDLWAWKVQWLAIGVTLLALIIGGIIGGLDWIKTH
jgi:hypothetical protein